MENREKAREERTHSIYAARYELKRYEKIYCLGQRSSYLWPSVTDRNCALENINNDHIDLQTTVPMANEQQYLCQMGELWTLRVFSDLLIICFISKQAQIITVSSWFNSVFDHDN